MEKINRRERSLKIQNDITEYIKQNPLARQIDVARACNVSRQMVSKYYSDCFLRAFDGDESQHPCKSTYFEKQKTLTDFIRLNPMTTMANCNEATGLSLVYVARYYQSCLESIPKEDFIGKELPATHPKEAADFAKYLFPDMDEDTYELLLDLLRKKIFLTKTVEHVKFYFHRELKIWKVTFF